MVLIVLLESLVDAHSDIFALYVSLSVLGFLLVFVLLEAARACTGDTSSHYNEYRNY